MPDRQYILFMFVGRRHSVTTLQVLLSAVFTCLTCFNLLHTGQAYSPAEKHYANAVVRIVCGRAPHCVPESFLSKFFLVCTFTFVFMQCL